MMQMRGKIVLVTGANAGMGLASATELAKAGADVIMACRSLERGEAARQQALAASGASHIELMACDLGDFASILAFCEAFKQRYDRLDVLLNNAGVVSLKRELTKDGYESMIGVNHLGHFLLTTSLLELLERSPQGRVVNVSSGAYKAGKIHFEDINLSRGFSVVKGYAQSKLANILFTKELARRLAHTRVTVNCLHPGAVGTSLGVNRQTGFGKSMHALLRPFFLTSLQGAQTALYLASSEEGGALSGHYFYKQKREEVSSKAKDEQAAKRLWEWSEQQVDQGRRAK
ncbi:NAD(P)-dependent dehydrogenase, short-chain alcohol dehydrogenase family [Paenibacillus algorifonticola]|uniref:NAD(P)-dependent dehydrogenase, short-chain alcohol dehydrogenase family n=1 Tax=Paenibacillus algorifonticola TaxID=684063 RepID=A0A1I2BE30_9BACL|nr:SDR family oxidoreductase [Paenibacillus algorifonticola]SFE54405.1 NAD(P)-dependent dehydrogenase, short-chain alcohol dehydrogenase family [Paenibacillus algorifonticola]